jgi:hypothetical protein
MYHGWGSLVEQKNPGGYTYTNPHTQHELQRLVREVVEPLGPTLMQIPEAPCEVAFLESFTSQMFSARGGYGSNIGWPADVWLALQHAHIQCDIMYEESLLNGALAGRKVLVMPHCDVLTKSVADAIRSWQAAGGKIIADEFLCPAIKADVKLASFQREKRAAADKAKTLALSGKLVNATATLLANPFICDNPEVITHRRSYGSTDYLFLVNDHREAGTYVGQHGLVLENGLPSIANIVSPPGKPRFGYDLKEGTRVQDGMSFQVKLGPADGSVFMFLDEPIAGPVVNGPDRAKAGSRALFKVAIHGASHRPVAAIIPVEVAIHDANGRLSEGSGYYGAKDGRLELPLDVAPNEDPGIWEIKVRELASRTTATAYLRVERP